MKVAVFDFDGTLADTLRDLADAVNHGLSVLGCPLHEYDAYKKFVGNGAMKLCERALPDDRKMLCGELHELFGAYYGQHFLDKTVLYDGMRETLDILRDMGVCLAIATNKPEQFAVKMTEALMPEYYFVKVLGGVDYRPKKPDRAIIDEILKAVPDADTVFMTGDSNVDIQTGKNCGAVTIGCTWGFRERDELIAEGADYIAESPKDIAEIIRKYYQ